MTDVLRKEWGFDGLVMTDWGAMHDRVKSLQAGLDLEMPGDTAICRKWILDGVKDGSLPMQVLDEAVKNVLTLVEKFVRLIPMTATLRQTMRSPVRSPRTAPCS